MIAFALLALTQLVGCTGLTTYTLSGRAVVGDFGEVVFVDPTDEELGGDPIGHAQISIHRDAGEMNQQLVAQGRTDGRGYFEIDLDAFGAGWMIEKWLIQVRKGGFLTVEQMVTFPSAYKDKRMLIVMTPGRSVEPRPNQDLWEEYERYRQ
jgi:hypothetical protein